MQFEDGTEVFGVEFVILATGRNCRFPFLDSSDPYNQPSWRVLPTNGRCVIVTTNTTHSRSEGEQWLRQPQLPLPNRQADRVSVLNALFFIDLPFLAANALNNIAQSVFAGHLIAHFDRVYPASRIAGQKDWNKTLVREVFLRNLTAFENWLASESFDVRHLGHRMNLGSYTDAEYQDSLITHLRTQGLPRHDGGYIFAEPWRTKTRRK